MNSNNIPFNALIVGQTYSGKSQFVVRQLCGPFRQKFDYIVLICATFTHNRTYCGFGIKDPRFYIVQCEQHKIEHWLGEVTTAFKGTNTLLILDDCAASCNVKGRTDKLVELAFSARHAGFSVWVLTQKMPA